MGKKNFKKRGGKTLEERKRELKEAAKVSKKSSQQSAPAGAKAPPPPAYSIDVLLDKAEKCIDEFSYELAQKFCQRALEQDADNVRALETSGILLLEMGNVESARQCLGRAVEVCPDEGFSKYMMLGQLFDGAQAVHHFQKGIELMLKGKEQREAQEVAVAHRKCEDGLTDTDISNAYCSVAEIFLTDLCEEEGAEKQCEDSVQKAVTSDPGNPEAHQLMASFLLSQDNKDEARESIKKSVLLWLPQLQSAEKGDVVDEEFDPVEVCPLTFATRMQAGKILIEVGEYELAAEVLELLLDEDEDVPELAAEVLELLLDEDEDVPELAAEVLELLLDEDEDVPELAAEVLELLLDEDEDVPEVWYLLGWAHYMQGADYAANSRHYLSRAMQVYTKVKHTDQDLKKHIADLLEELGPGEGLAEEEGECEEGEVDIESSDDEEAEAMDQ
ncbi:hypothetical protein ACOMHN_025297 [Nucella lapillus]